jgi:hypothetical protein
VRAVKFSARLIERVSDTRSRSCASQHSRKGSPGFGLLSERHGEGAAAQSLELSSQAIGLFQFCQGYGFDGCHCRLGRRRLSALCNELGVIAGEGRLEELLIEWPVVLPYLMAMTSLTTVVALRWLAVASTRVTTAAT